MLFSVSISGFAGVRSCRGFEWLGRPISWHLQTATDTAKKLRKY